MRRSVVAVLCAIAGLLAGAGAALVVQGPQPLPMSPLTSDGRTVTPAPSTAAPSTTSDIPDTRRDTAPDPPEGSEVLLVWTPGRLPADFADDVATIDGVQAVTSVRSDLAHLTATFDELGRPVDGPDNGFVIPIEVMAYDPATYPAFVPAELLSLFASSGGGEAILGATSARIRRLGTGGILLLEDGTELTVAAVVDDGVIGAAEVVVTGDLRAAVARERYLLVRFRGERTVIEAGVRDLLPEGTPARIRGPGETPVFRHGDAVLPQAIVKDRFGEFPYRPGRGLSFAIDPVWVEENVVTAQVPILGEIRCHRSIVPLVDGAMAELEERELTHLVDRGTYRGCYTPRYIAGGKGLSRHSWGIALDINWGTNPTGIASAQDPRLIETMERWGFVSGDEWLVPDPGHFEWVTDPAG